MSRLSITPPGGTVQLVSVQFLKEAETGIPSTVSTYWEGTGFRSGMCAAALTLQSVAWRAEKGTLPIG